MTKMRPARPLLLRARPRQREQGWSPTACANDEWLGQRWVRSEWPVSWKQIAMELCTAISRDVTSRAAVDS